ncbi:hypothetical protein SAMN05443661_12814 [Natronobacterium gregoryi]|uniref:Uncharacterized protein n=2 Tax=Natronobacterium gregoryi TaxID=44930 RepID=L0AL96_NATGS|nr:hypothetical protein Natgr_2676 [Natronobacterium gregoryi SP2]ELY65072.1 hypothetical protein C490_13920 [Natronobacterium gregoryi SP2]SFJ41906.1 hypothetical protein SAMN05443661_12814 [Natronobacterium gregoryi]
MNELAFVVLETELPMGIAGWGTLALGVLVTAVWLIYLYR